MTEREPRKMRHNKPTEIIEVLRDHGIIEKLKEAGVVERNVSVEELLSDAKGADNAALAKKYVVCGSKGCLIKDY